MIPYRIGSKKWFGGMEFKIETGYGMWDLRICKGGIRDKHLLAEAGCAHFIRRDAGRV